MSNHYDKPNTGAVFKSETGKLYVFRPERIAVILA